jgi:hypothetical protein
MRFVAGGWFGAKSLTSVVTGNRQQRALTTASAGSGT